MTPSQSAAMFSIAALSFCLLFSTLWGSEANGESTPCTGETSTPFILSVASHFSMTFLERTELPSLVDDGSPLEKAKVAVFGEEGGHPIVGMVTTQSLLLFTRSGDGTIVPIAPLALPGCETPICDFFARDLDHDGVKEGILHNVRTRELHVIPGKAPRQTIPFGELPAATRILGVIPLAGGVFLYAWNGNEISRYAISEKTLGGRQQVLAPRPGILKNLRVVVRGGEPWLSDASAAPPLGFTETSLTDPSPRFLLTTQLNPRDLAWKENWEFADLDGNEEPELVAAAASSRNIWASVAAPGGRFEVPIRSETEFDPNWQIVAPGDLNGDGLEDLLLFDRKNRRWIEGLSHSFAPFPGHILRAESQSIEVHGGGMVCAPRALFRRGSRFSSEGVEYEVDHSIRVSGYREHIIAKAIVHDGSPYSVPYRNKGPFICNGFQPSNHAIGRKWGATVGRCAGVAGMYFTTEPSHEPASGQRLDSSCCPLPFEDIFIDEPETFTDSVCPPGSVVSGKVPEADRGPNLWICRRVSTRYQLGPETPGAYFGEGYSRSEHRVRIRTEQIPLAIRPAAGRMHFNDWDHDGCVGSPPGSLLVGRIDGEKGCARIRFRELQYRGLPGDPPPGTRVKMFPSCTRLGSDFSTTQACFDDSKE